MFYIPIPDGPDTTQTITLDNIKYSLRFRWNTLSELWCIYFGVYGGEFICKIPITIGFEMLAPYRAYDGVPKGALFALDVEKTTGRIDIDNFSGAKSRYRLVYVPEDEL